MALIRPGPIKGNMVDPFLARRHGREETTYIHPKLEKILGSTYGVVLYQEQVIEIATELAGYTPGEADRLRKAMTKFRSDVYKRQQSRIVITHDGAGSILNCLLNKKITVVVPRLKEFNECKYENKLDLALELEKQNKIHLIRDIDQLNLKLIEDLKTIGRMEDSKAIGNFESKNNLLINIKKYIKI